LEIEDRTVPADPDVAARIYRPHRAQCAIVWLHGGGFVMGDLDTEHPAAASASGGMVDGMATRKVTITLDEAQLDQIRSLVQARTAPSVSGFVQHAVAVALDDVAGWGAMLAEALRQTGGALTDDERAWADEVLGTGTRPAA
jgi:Arc/MetJ-type ribon-helix-helix transcriptional regulator